MNCKMLKAIPVADGSKYDLSFAQTNLMQTHLKIHFKDGIIYFLIRGIFKKSRVNKPSKYITQNPAHTVYNI